MITPELDRASSMNDAPPAVIERLAPDVAEAAVAEELLEVDAGEEEDRGFLEVVKEAGTVRVLEPAETGLLEAVDTDEPDDVEEPRELRLEEVELAAVVDWDEEPVDGPAVPLVALDVDEIRAVAEDVDAEGAVEADEVPPEVLKLLLTEMVAVTEFCDALATVEGTGMLDVSLGTGD